MRLLFTGGGGAGNEAIWRLLGDRYELHFADADPQAIDPAVPAARRHRIPMADAADFADALVALCRRTMIDLLVPGVDEELPHMPAVAAALPALGILVPQPEYVALARDKLRLAEDLARRGLESPRTVPFARWREIGLPLIAKPRQGRGSRGVRIIASEAEAEAYRVLAGEPDDQLIAQEKLEGQEFTVLMAADRAGRLAAIVPVAVGQKRGVTLSGETQADDAVIDACRRIHAALPARGCCNIQLIRTKDRRCVPFEINPRISTTFCLALAAGIDPVAIYTGAPDASQGLLPFAAGVRLRRRWSNHFSGPGIQS